VIGEPRLYSADGKPKALTKAQSAKPLDAVAAAARAGGFVWLGLTNPSEDEMTEVGTAYDLHPLAVADASSGKQQPKVQSYPQHLFIVMWALMYRKPKYDVSIGETFVFARPGLLVTVERHDARFKVSMQDVIERPADNFSGGVMSAVYEVMANIVRGYTEVSSVIERELEEIEEQVFDEDQKDDSKRIYALRKQIGKVNRAVSGIAISLTNARDHFEKLSIGNERVGVYFQDLIDDLIGTDQLTTDQNAALDGVVATHENTVASQQNIDSRRISAVAALVAIPAVVAGIFGMNYKNFPTVGWTYGWIVSIGIILVLEVWAFIAFKRRRWL
jgi:magnesium transporter